MMFIVAIVLAFAAVVISPSTCAKSPEEYLQYGPYHHAKELKWLAKRIESGAWGASAETVAANLRAAHETAEEVFRRQNQAAIWSAEGLVDTSGILTYDKLDNMLALDSVVLDLLAYSNERASEAKCYNHEAQTLLALADMKFGGIAKLQRSLGKPSKSPLMKYLQQYLREHSATCAALAGDLFARDAQELPADIEAQLDSMVSMGEQFPAEEADARLASQAETLDLAKGKFDAKKMLPVAEQYGLPAGFIKPSEPGELLARHLVVRCDSVRQNTHFDMFNLAKILVPEVAPKAVEESAKFRKLNEYSRICIPFRSTHGSEKAIANVVKNMKRN